jgi:hypothetical protein
VNAWLGLLAVLTCVTLVLTALRPGLAVSLVIFAASAAFGAYRLAASTAFVLRVPPPAVRRSAHAAPRRSSVP